MTITRLLKTPRCTSRGPACSPTIPIPQGYSLLANVVSCPSNGSLSFNSDGPFYHRPYGGFTGTDSFTYKAL
ncbi:MAG: Ig-like domain-containing protein [Verrucomicrobiia bacterium]